MDKTIISKRGNYNDIIVSMVKPQLQQAIKNNLNYYEMVQKKLDLHQTKVASIQIRKKMLERQKVHNYQNEYDRIRGLIAQNIVKHGDHSLDGLRKREKALEKLGATVIDHIV